MLKKISDFPLKAYIAFTGFKRDLREDDHGLSGIVVAVLLILIAVLAVVIIWGSLGTWIKDLWEKIVGKSDSIN